MSEEGILEGCGILEGGNAVESQRKQELGFERTAQRERQLQGHAGGSHKFSHYLRHKKGVSSTEQ